MHIGKQARRLGCLMLGNAENHVYTATWLERLFRKVGTSGKPISQMSSGSLWLAPNYDTPRRKLII